MSKKNSDSSFDSWDFPGWGTSKKILDIKPESVDVHRLDQPTKHRLGAWSATAICGNDITSSCLYVSALCAAQAGKWAPLVLAVVAGVLYLFRKIYAEVGSALPLNGGTYTVLLNTTNKKVAAAAAGLTLLSYVATAVISASEAMHYAQNLWHSLDVFSATIGLLGVFALLNILGISESARVALVIFIFHITTLTVLVVSGLIFLVQDPSILLSNWQLPATHNFGKALFFGFAAAMLGISGFESSANFIEEQQPGVFPKTLRNMWLAVSIFNPLISFLSLSLLPLPEIEQIPPDLLATMGEKSFGPILRSWISVDAVLVLSGAVLTSYVGVTGLVRRMTLDRCLPQFLLLENPWRRTNHYIIIMFFLVCCSILFITVGEVSTLAGVYTLSFLSVMALFAIGNALLKTRRRHLPRETRASWSFVAIGLFSVLLGILGNVLMDFKNLQIFQVYFLVTLGLIGAMLMRTHILRLFLFVIEASVTWVVSINKKLGDRVKKEIESIGSRPVIYFTRGDALQQLNKAALYVLQNEQTKCMKVVHVFEDEKDIPKGLAEHLKEIDHLYPELRIDFLAVKGTFGPDLIEKLSRRLNIPKNYMFIGTPSDRFPHRIEKLGGVRLILS